jgi:hypothetical protein
MTCLAMPELDDDELNELAALADLHDVGEHPSLEVSRVTATEMYHKIHSRH